MAIGRSLAAAAAMTLATGLGGAAAQDAVGFSMADFQLQTAQDLVDICTLDESNSSYWEARAFCLGYFIGGDQYHDAIASGPGYEPIACPGPEVTLAEAAAEFITFTSANPEYMEDRPMDVVFRAIATRWPCE